MADTNTISDTESHETITLTSPNLEATIILDWDDGQWYISNIQSTTGSSESSEAVEQKQATTDTNGVKLATWDAGYKYANKDIVAYDGSLYVSKQNVNQGNTPTDGTFWWGIVVDLSTVDAITLEGKNLQEISRDILAGNVITDFYKKTEVDNIILTYFNNVNAKKLDNKTLPEIIAEYEAKIAAAELRAKDFTTDYLNNDSSTSFQQMLVNEFTDGLAADNVNQLGG